MRVRVAVAVITKVAVSVRVCVGRIMRVGVQVTVGDGVSVGGSGVLVGADVRVWNGGKVGLGLVGVREMVGLMVGALVVGVLVGGEIAKVGVVTKKDTGVRVASVARPVQSPTVAQRISGAYTWNIQAKSPINIPRNVRQV